MSTTFAIPLLLAVTPASAKDACPIVPGIAALIESDARYIVLGEVHGTRQSPAMFGAIACNMAAGERILVAVELSSRDDAILQHAWAGPVDAFRRRLIMPQSDWGFRSDGVASRAMLAMLTDLHRRKQAGAAIGVVAFNGARDVAQEDRWKHLAGQGPHEAAQAENIRTAAAVGGYDRVLVLVGAFHASRKAVTWKAGTFEPMAMHLGNRGAVLSLKMEYGAGSSWTCQPRDGVKPSDQPMSPDDIECRSRPLIASSAMMGSPRVTVDPRSLPASVRAAGYDGAYYVGPADASPPVAGVAASTRASNGRDR